MLSRTQRSAIFTSYNRQRAAGEVERGRLNRALGLAQSNEERPYTTSAESCTCPDWQYRVSVKRGQCKHQAALMLAVAGAEAEAAAEAVAKAEQVDAVEEQPAVAVVEKPAPRPSRIDLLR